MLKRPNTPILIVMIMAAAAAVFAPAEARAASSQTPTSFADLYQNRHGIAAEAWTKTNKVLKANLTSPKIQIFLGPTTTLPSKTQAADITAALKAFPSANPFTKVDIFYFNKQDMAASADQVNKEMGDQEARKIFNQRAWAQLGPNDPIPQGTNPLIHCIGSGECTTGEGWAGSDGVAYLGLSVPQTPYTSDNPGTKMDAVEFYHALWQSYYVARGTLQGNTTDGQNWFSPINTPPFWLQVSGENQTFYDAVGLGTYANYEKTMVSLLQKMKYLAPKPYSVWGAKFDLNWLNNFLDISNFNVTSTTSWQNSSFSNNLAFSVGTNIYQILVALKGPQFMYDLTNYMSQGSTFDQAFQREFGVSWMSAEPTIAKTIWDEYQGKY